ncbi:UBX domain-containing protein 1 [Galendromus occidentalis]|uniref:UBX domain-containing protein 1 n=1 Tax=Galendromus occidentalis TaxID=34638 RepID=A0AAJ6W0S1_9ACAR|nr:UBX domain-containing protein 1 [Galendromus occidentalis]
MSIAEDLKEMGFASDKVEQAVRAAGDSLEQAMEWILAHQDEPSTSAATAGAVATPFAAEEKDKAQEESAAEAPAAEVRSMRCDDCQKLFPNEDALVFHASKTGHSNFSESTEQVKPKSPEEVKAQLAALEAKIKENRRIREEKERQEALDREKNRRTHGKEIVELRQKFKDDEMKREVEARRREKEADALARKRVLEQIERDREERRQRQAGAAAAPKSTAAPAPIAVSAPAKEYAETRIQIRLTDGKIMNQSFRAEDSLAIVRCYIITNRTDGDVPFQLMTSFPKKVYGEEDMSKTLKDLKLVPSAVLILNKSESVQAY